MARCSASRCEDSSKSEVPLRHPPPRREPDGIQDTREALSVEDANTPGTMVSGVSCSSGRGDSGSVAAEKCRVDPRSFTSSDTISDTAASRWPNASRDLQMSGRPACRRSLRDADEGAHRHRPPRLDACATLPGNETDCPPARQQPLRPQALAVSPGSERQSLGQAANGHAMAKFIRETSGYGAELASFHFRILRGGSHSAPRSLAAADPELAAPAGGAGSNHATSVASSSSFLVLVEVRMPS
jgi:hypothetical protein